VAARAVAKLQQQVQTPHHWHCLKKFWNGTLGHGMPSTRDEDNLLFLKMLKGQPGHVRDCRYAADHQINLSSGTP
jgi:hypothetical protein